MPARRLQPGGGGGKGKEGSAGRVLRERGAFPRGKGSAAGGQHPRTCLGCSPCPCLVPGRRWFGTCPLGKGSWGGGRITKANKTLSHQAAPSRIPARAGRVDEGLRVARNTFLGMRDWGNWGPAPASLRASFPPPTYSPWSRLGLRFVFFPRLEKYRFILRGCEV